MKEKIDAQDIENISGGRRRPRAPQSNGLPEGIIECARCGNEIEALTAETRTVNGKECRYCTGCGSWVDENGEPQAASATLGNFVPGK